MPAQTEDALGHAQPRAQEVGVERLGEEVGVFLGGPGPDAAAQLEAVDIGHDPVDHGDLDRRGAQQVPGLDATGSDHHLVPELLQHRLDQQTDARVVVSDEILMPPCACQAAGGVGSTRRI